MTTEQTDEQRKCVAQLRLYLDVLRDDSGDKAMLGVQIREVRAVFAELDAARARERHALVAGAEALRRIAAATPIGHEDVTKGPSTYTWLCYAASLLMAEAATTPATPLEQELITMRAREAKLREALEPFAAYMDAREAKPFLGLGDTIHAIHTGTEWAAELTLAHCKAARAALAEGEDTPRTEVVEPPIQSVGQEPIKVVNLMEALRRSLDAVLRQDPNMQVRAVRYSAEDK